MTGGRSNLTGWLLVGALAIVGHNAMGREDAGDMELFRAAEWASLAGDWRLVTDQVMGGVSQGNTLVTEEGGRRCQRLRGNVSTANNGGFVQIAMELADGGRLDASAYAGIELEVRGNGEDYNLHLRTTDTRLPWQAYRASFRAEPSWQTLRLPFEQFEGYRIGRALRVDRLRRLGVVAIGRPFQADVCVARVALYRDGGTK